MQLFCALGTQWRRAGMTGVRSGLDYGVIAPTAALMEIETSRDLLDRLRIMEAEVLRIDATRAAAEKGRGNDR